MKALPSARLRATQRYWLASREALATAYGPAVRQLKIITTAQGEDCQRLRKAAESSLASLLRRAEHDFPARLFS